jgi:3-oxoacyl-[acyl-carrier protein] reductase
MTADLSGKTALITGGASGIGLAAAEAFGRRGAKVAINHLPDDPRGPAQASRLAALGISAVAVAGNVSRPDEADAMVKAAIDRLGRLDYLVNNAGTPGTTEPIALNDLDRMTEDFWQLLLSTNLIGPFRCARAAASALKQSRGAIVNTSSVAGINMVGSSIAYGASKAGLINVTRTLARALAPEVRVNAVAPGHVDSDWTRAWPEERKEMARERAVLKRVCKPEDIAAVIVFLCADTSVVTGQTIVADAGYSL